MNVEELAIKIRQLSLLAIHAAGSGHPGGVLSCADIVSVLVKSELGWFIHNKNNYNRFVMSKGHACPALYAAAACAEKINLKHCFY